MSHKRAFDPSQVAAASAIPAGVRVAFFRPAAPSPPLRSGIKEEGGKTAWPLRFFDLKRDPFSDAADEEFFCSNATIRQVYQELITSLVEKPGIAVLTGEAGVGKTILGRRLCNELRSSGYLVARCPAGLVFDELITAIAKEMRIPDGIEDRAERLHKFRENVERSRGARPPVVVIDGAEELGGDVIANLSKLLAGATDCSLRILLSGRPELATRLDLPVFAGLKRMRSGSWCLERLADNDAASYIFHRLRRAGHRGNTVFSSAAINTVIEQAAGLPRHINRLCTQSLVVAAAAGKPIVTSEIVEKAAGESRPNDASPLRAGPPPVRHNRTARAAVIAAAIIVAGIVIDSLRERAADLVATAATPPEVDAVPLERRSGNDMPALDRLQEEPLAQAVQLASNEAEPRNELAPPPEVDVGNAAPVMVLATDDADKDFSGTSAAERSADSQFGADGSNGEEQPPAGETSKTEDLGQWKPDQAPGGDAPPEAGDRMPATGDLGQAQVVDPGEMDDGAKAKASEERSVAPVGPGAEEPAQSSESGVRASAMPQPLSTNPAPPIAGAILQQGQAGEGGASGNSAQPEANPQTSGAAAAIPAVTTPAAPQMAAELIAALMKRGDELIRIGDISGARLAYERAAAGGSARAMTALGMTHDPSFLRGANARGIRPDPAIAMEWYRKAAALGDAEAAARMQQLPALAR